MDPAPGSSPNPELPSYWRRAEVVASGIDLAGQSLGGTDCGGDGIRAVVIVMGVPVTAMR